jgi:hypothetical protein
MATYGVCSDPTVAPGGNFAWNNPNAQTVVITPAPNTTWPLPQSSYTVSGNSTTSPIYLPSTATPGDYPISVKYQNTATSPCQLMGTTPKIIIQVGKKK